MAVLEVGTTLNNLKAISLDPSSLVWGLQDISSSDAGRTHSAGNPMYKMRTSQKRKLDITWTMPTPAQASEILKAFNPEYFYVRYFDPMDNQRETRLFYAGDRSAPFKWYDLKGKGTRFANLSFNVIER